MDKVYKHNDEIYVIKINEILHISKIDYAFDDRHNAYNSYRGFKITYYNGTTQNIVAHLSDYGHEHVDDNDPYFGYNRSSYRSYSRKEEREDMEEKWRDNYGHEISEEKAKEKIEENKRIRENNQEVIKRVERTLELFRESLVIDMGLGDAKELINTIDLRK